VSRLRDRKPDAAIVELWVLCAVSLHPWEARASQGVERWQPNDIVLLADDQSAGDPG